MNLINLCLDLAKNPKHAKWLSPLLLLADAILCALVIWKVPYTEIDWKAYMEQVEQYTNGERDYTKIRGATGPLVYPGAHVAIYKILYEVTNRGTNIKLAQIIFAGVYLFVLAIVFACYRQAKAPPYVFPLLVLSKRLHSIFLLRCFNDCFAVAALWVSIYSYQNRMWTIGSVFYSIALGVKMSVLLALPAVGLILLQALGRNRTIAQAIIIGQLQVLFGYPFLRTSATGYFSRAFELTRVFLYRWTVNWRFIPENIFLSKTFAFILLASHVALLVLFATTRWVRPSQMSLFELIPPALRQREFYQQDQIRRRIGPQFILTTILAANATGMLCARSLHYQFYSWIAWASPLLLWRAGFNPILQYGLWAAQEWAWNVYPSTPISSITVVGVLAITTAGVWWGTRRDFCRRRKGTIRTNEHAD